MKYGWGYIQCLFEQTPALMPRPAIQTPHTGGIYDVCRWDDAAKRLAIALSEYRDRNPLVLAIPRGAVPWQKSLPMS